MRTERRKVLEEFHRALRDRTAHPTFISSHLSLVLARAELERYLMLPWHQRLSREFVAWVRGGKLISASFSSSLPARLS